MELEFWIAIVLDVLAAVGLVYLARSRKAQPPLLKALTLALGLLFIFFTSANCAERHPLSAHPQPDRPGAQLRCFVSRADRRAGGTRR